MKNKNLKIKKMRIFNRYKGKHYRKDNLYTYFFKKINNLLIKLIIFPLYLHIFNNIICPYIFNTVLKYIRHF